MNTIERFERNISIINAYNEGDTIKDVAQSHGLTQATILNVVRQGRDAGVVTRTPRSRGSDNEARDREIADLYMTGKSMEELGSKWDLTRERVRQILSKQEITSRTIADYAAEAYKVWVSTHGIEVTEVFNQTRSIATVIERFPQFSAAWIRRFLADRRHETVRTHEVARFWTEERITRSLRLAATDGILTIPRYQKWRTSGVVIDERIPPTHTLIVWRFGSWVNALAAAGLRTSDRLNHRTYTRSWTSGDAINAVKTYTKQALSEDSRPTFSGYEQWVKAHPGNPSGSYLRYLTGKPWAEILREALT
jgi:Mor family transcriptional regulator